MQRSYEEEVPRLRRLGGGFALAGVVLLAIEPYVTTVVAIAVLVGVTVASVAAERSLADHTYVSQGIGLAVVVVAAGVALGTEFPLLELAALCIVAGVLQALAAPFLATIRTVGT